MDLKMCSSGSKHDNVHEPSSFFFDVLQTQLKSNYINMHHRFFA